MKKILIGLMCALILTASADAASKATVSFRHRVNEKYNYTMKLSSLKNLSKLLPASLKEEVGQEYYPQLRAGLKSGGSMKFKKADATVTKLDGDLVRLDLAFPKFYLIIDNVTWDELDHFFKKYFDWPGEMTAKV